MRQKHLLVTASGLIALSGTPAGAGDLNPPAGPVEGTMTTLRHIEPRVCINDLPGDPDSVHRITLPGRYFLRAGVPVIAGKMGIEVDVPPGVSGEVSIDLNGYSIEGQPGSLDGVRYRNNEDCTWTFQCPTGRIVGMGGDGIHIEGGDEASISGVSIVNCGGDGMELRGIRRNLEIEMERRSGGFLVSQNGGNGVVTADCDEVSITGLNASDNAGDGVRVENSGFVRIRDTDSNRNDGDGIRFINLTAQAQAAAEKADLSSIRCVGNGADGVHLENVGDASLTDFHVSDSGNDGIELNDTQASGGSHWTVNQGMTGNNHGRGLYLVVGDTVDFIVEARGCTSRNNLGSGLFIESALGGGGGGGGGALSDEIRLSDSIFADNGLDGVTLDRSRRDSIDMHVTIERTTMNSNVRTGLTSTFANGDIPNQDQFVTLIDSRACSNGFSGMDIDSCAVMVQGGSASGNGGDGVTLRTRINALEARLQAIGLLAFTASGNGGHGVSIDGGTLTLDGCRLVGNVRQGASAHCWSTQCRSTNCNENGEGGLLLEGGSATIESSTFAGNGFGSPAAGDGLRASGTGGVVVRAVDAYGNARVGLGISTSLQWSSRLESVTASNNGSSGILFETATGLPCGRATLTQCSADNNGSHGIDIQCSSGVEVRECVMRGNGGLGASAPGIGHVFVWNTCADNALGPYFIPLPGNSVGPALEEAFMMTDEKPHSNYIR